MLLPDQKKILKILNKFRYFYNFVLTYHFALCTYKIFVRIGNEIFCSYKFKLNAAYL